MQRPKGGNTACHIVLQTVCGWGWGAWSVGGERSELEPIPDFLTCESAPGSPEVGGQETGRECRWRPYRASVACIWQLEPDVNKAWASLGKRDEEAQLQASHQSDTHG